jgi:putative NIF3 family GTP cyclohydrolase 1 type 2
MRISDAIERILDHMPKRLPAGGCDRVVHGDAQRELHGIAVTFMASRAVLERAAAAGADFIVTHEPTWWNHHDHTDWLAGDPVQRDKAAFIEAHGQVLWRLHDHVHVGWPDLIARGMLQALGWEAQVVAERAGIVELPAQPLRAVAEHVRTRLGAAAVRVAGDLDAPVSRIAFLPGACGGRRQIDHLKLPDVDAVFCGESAEWETCEYVRDAVAGGGTKGLIVAGHANSEEAGMEHVAQLIRTWFPEVPVVHLPTGDPFSVLT